MKWYKYEPKHGDKIRFLDEKIEFIIPQHKIEQIGTYINCLNECQICEEIIKEEYIKIYLNYIKEEISNDRGFTKSNSN